MLSTRDFVKKMYDETELTWSQAETAVRHFIGAMKSTIAEGEEITFQGLLTVRRADRAARVYRTGITGTTEKPAHNKPVIRLSPPLVKKATI